MAPAGYAVRATPDGDEALLMAAEEVPDLVILDWMIEGTSGIEVCRRLRRDKRTAHVPIVMLTAREAEDDRIRGLETGADDYVTKPFSPRELVARVKAILKRTSGPVAQVLTRGALSLDLRARSCTAHGAPLALTATEFQLLAAFMAEPDRLMTRAALVTALWGPGSQVADRTLDSHLRNLRRKLSEAGLAEVIETLHGQGMRLALPA